MHVGKDLVAASATPMVLAILAEGESYGYAIIKRVGELSDGEITWTDGMLYPLLHRLERLGYVESTWRSAAETGERRRKYYRLTSDGSEALADQRSQWQVVSDALDRIWTDVSCSQTFARRPAPIRSIHSRPAPIRSLHHRPPSIWSPGT